MTSSNITCPYSVRWEDKDGTHTIEFPTYDEAVEFENNLDDSSNPPIWSELRQPGQMRRWDRTPRRW